MPFAFQMLRPEDPRRAVFKEFHPSLFLYTSTIRRHIVFGRPLFLLPSGVHPRATAQLFAADPVPPPSMTTNLSLLFIYIQAYF